MPLTIVGVNGVKIVHIVLKVWFLVWSFLRSRGKVWFGAQAKLKHLTSQWRHNDVKFFVDDVIMTSYNVIFTCAPNQNLFLSLRNLHTKIHPFRTMCTIPLLFSTICLHYRNEKNRGGGSGDWHSFLLNLRVLESLIKLIQLIQLIHRKGGGRCQWKFTCGL